ncbi:MBL fold metallo-hydrolase [Flavobacterium aquidurense]|uniref:MBL fold metallo-hydrolase n=1 Tax=Flavobacterium aquidurense TaxID=362413 RepID=UPI003756634B
MKIIPLQEGNYVVNSDKEFRLIEDFPLDSGLKMAIQPFLIVTQNDCILLDLGLGLKKNGKPLIHHLLESHGVAPEQITKILISHFHKDHIEGIGSFEEDTFIQNFPEATIYLQSRELDFALSQQHPSYNLELLNQLQSFSNVVKLEEDKGQITDEIFYEVSGGHSPFHQVFRIQENNEIAFYGADDLPQEAYLKLHVAYKTDYDGKRAMKSRKKWEQEAKEQHWKVLLYHDMKKPVLEF